MRVRRFALIGMVVGAAALAVPSFAGAETLVTNGSPPSPFSQNKQNEPGVAVD